jgi:hypothetical protein
MCGWTPVLPGVPIFLEFFVPGLDSGEHIVEYVDQNAGFIFGVLFSPDRKIFFLRYRPGDLGQAQDWVGN